MMEEDRSKPPAAPEEIAIGYANNIFLESSIWDLKLIFGEWSGRAKQVDWHSSVTIPWAVAKLFQYYLGLNIEAHEKTHGKIPFPKNFVPPEPPPPDPNDTAARDFYDMVVRHRKRFLDNL